MNGHRNRLAVALVGIACGGLACSAAPDERGQSESSALRPVGDGVGPTTPTHSPPPPPPPAPAPSATANPGPPASVGTASFACGDDLGHSAPNCVMTYPPDAGEYLISAFAVKTASGQCPPVSMSNGTWDAQTQVGPICSSFRASDGEHSLTTPWCLYVFQPNQDAVPDDSLYDHYTHQPLNAAGLCSSDVVLIEPVAGSGHPHGPGCSTCMGSIVVPMPP